MKHLIYIFLGLISSVAFTIQAEQDQKRSVLFYTSSDFKEHVGKGQTYLYDESNSQIFVHFDQAYQSIHVHCSSNGSYYNDYWDLRVKPTWGNHLTTGLYLNAATIRDLKHPSLEFSGNHREAGEEGGKFEILEFKCDEQNNVLSLAINFLQTDQNGRYFIFGCVRYNSSYPVEIQAHEFLGVEKYPHYTLLSDPSYILMYDHHNKIQHDYSSFSSSRKIDYFNNLKSIYFFKGNVLTIYLYDPYIDMFCLIEVIDQTEDIEGLFTQENAEEYYVQIKTNLDKFSESSEIRYSLKELLVSDESVLGFALNFRIEEKSSVYDDSADHNYSEVAIRFNSEIPINLLRPYYE